MENILLISCMIALLGLGIALLWKPDTTIGFLLIMTLFVIGSIISVVVFCVIFVFLVIAAIITGISNIINRY